MSKDELSAYYRHLDNTVILKDNIYTSRGEGLLEGREMGRKEGLQEGIREGMKKGMERGRKEGIEEGIRKAKIQMVKTLKSSGASMEFMTNVTGLTEEEIVRLL